MCLLKISELSSITYVLHLASDDTAQIFLHIFIFASVWWNSTQSVSKIGTSMEFNIDWEDRSKVIAPDIVYQPEPGSSTVLLRPHLGGEDEIAPNIALDAHLLVKVQELAPSPPDGRERHAKIPLPERALAKPEVESRAVGPVGRDAQAHAQLAPLLELDHIHQSAAWHVDRLVGANPR